MCGRVCAHAQVITPGATLWQGALDLYNNASYADLVLTVGGKKVFFVPDNPTLPPDPTTMSAIESNGGRNDVTVVLMWADFNPDKYPTGMWGFFSPCRCVNLLAARHRRAARAIVFPREWPCH